jgi:hypothetical protein
MVTRPAENGLDAASPPAPSRAGLASAGPGIAFVGGVLLVLLYGLRGGGSYDALVFQENGLVVWWLLAIGLGLGLLPRTRPSRGLILLLAALTAYAAWTALSLTWTDSSELTSTEVARVLDYLGLVALIGSVLDRETWRPAAAGLAFGALLVCAVAAGSRLAPSVFGKDQVDAVLHQDRLSVPFGYWNAVGAWGAMSAAVALAWSAHDRSRFRRAVALGFVPVAALTTYLTYSRTGIAATGVGVVAVLILSRNRVTTLAHAVVAAAGTVLVVIAVRGAPDIAHGTGTAGAARVLGALLVAAGACGVAAALTLGTADRLRFSRRIARRLLAGAGLLLAVGAVVLGPHLVSRAWHSFTRAPGSSLLSTANPTARLASFSGDNRYQLWKSTLKAFDSHPLEGIGAGTIQFWWNEHATDGSFIRDSHSIWLQNLGELGVPGFLLIVAVAGGALAIGLRARRRVRRTVSAGAVTAGLSAFVVYLVAASVDWMWESTAVTVLALAGTAVLGVRLGQKRPRLNVPLRIIVVILALGAGVMQLPGILSTMATRRSQTAERSGQANTAFAWARAAVDSEPWSASAYQQLGLVEESAGQLRSAARDLEHSISREPQNYVHWLLLSRIETERGQLDAAVRAYDRARQLRPRATVFAQPVKLR